MEGPSTSQGRFFSMRSLIPVSSSSVVNNLLSWKQLDEDDKWTEKAVSTLVKKLKEKKDSIKDLERALSCPGAPSKCVTVPCTLDGRLQILHRKAFPHVIYCRIWRWRDLQNHHELTSLPECQFAFSKKLSEVCVNPYHYNRVDALVLPPVMVPQHNEFVSGHSLLPFQQLREPSMPQTVTYTENGFTGLDLGAARLTSSKPQNSNLVELQPPAHHSAYSNLIAELNIGDYQLGESQPPPQPINYIEEHPWASISYYELNHRVGEVFKCNNTSIIVDGFTNPNEDGDRFCLGQLSNIHRNSTIERARKNIGNGIHLYYVNGEVYVECLSSQSIFVQSKICNLVNNFYPSTVYKISPGSAVKVFDSAEFAKVLSRCANCSYDSVFQLIEMCIIRIAFVKGWGAQYSRADITSTPAWVEIIFHGPLKWQDRVLIAMGGPTGQIDSVS